MRAEGGPIANLRSTHRRRTSWRIEPRSATNSALRRSAPRLVPLLGDLPQLLQRACSAGRRRAPSKNSVGALQRREVLKFTLCRWGFVERRDLRVEAGLEDAVGAVQDRQMRRAGRGDANALRAPCFRRRESRRELWMPEPIFPVSARVCNVRERWCCWKGVRGPPCGDVGMDSRCVALGRHLPACV